MKRKKYILTVCIVIIYIIGFSILVLPAKKQFIGTRTILAGKYNWDSQKLLPAKRITDPKIVALVEGELNNAPTIIKSPTLGHLGGPVVLVDSENNIIACLFLRREMGGLVSYSGSWDNGYIKINRKDNILVRVMLTPDLFIRIRDNWLAIDNN